MKANTNRYETRNKSYSTTSDENSFRVKSRTISMGGTNKRKPKPPSRASINLIIKENNVAFGKKIPPKKPAMAFGSTIPRADPNASKLFNYRPANVPPTVAPKSRIPNFRLSGATKFNARVGRPPKDAPSDADEFECRPDVRESILNNIAIDRNQLNQGPGSFLPRTSLLGRDMSNGRGSSIFARRSSIATPLRRNNATDFTSATPRSSVSRLTQFMASAKRVNFSIEDKENMTPARDKPSTTKEDSRIRSENTKPDKIEDSLKTPGSFMEDIKCLSPLSLNLKLEEVNKLLEEIHLKKEEIAKQEATARDMKSAVNNMLGAKSTVKKIPPRLSMITEVTERDSIENDASRASTSKVRGELFPDKKIVDVPCKETMKARSKSRRRSAFRSLKSEVDDSLVTVIEEGDTDTDDESTVLFLAAPQLNGSLDMSVVGDETLQHTSALNPLQDFGSTPTNSNAYSDEKEKEKLLLMSSKMPKTPIPRRCKSKNKSPENFEALTFYDADTVAVDAPIRTTLYIKSMASTAKHIQQQTVQKDRGHDGSTPKKGKEHDENTPKKGKEHDGSTPKKGKVQDGSTPKKGKGQDGSTPKKGKVQDGSTPKKGKVQDGSTPKNGNGHEHDDGSIPKGTPVPKPRMSKAPKESLDINKDESVVLSPAYCTRSRARGLNIVILEDSPSTANSSFMCASRTAFNSSVLPGRNGVMMPPPDLSPITILPPSKGTRRMNLARINDDEQCSKEVELYISAIPKKRAKKDDRSSNPVASVLTTGDDMNFVPIRRPEDKVVEI